MTTGQDNENAQQKMRPTRAKARRIKVPVILQMEAAECGAASLDMVLAHYRKWIPLEKLREDCGVSRDGSTARNILKAARNHGLEAKGFKYEAEELAAKTSFPCILFWNFSHFVVLEGFKRGGATACISDPARGRYDLEFEKFKHSYSGICITLSPGPDFRPEGKPRSVLGFVRERLTGSFSALVLLALMSALIAVGGIVQPSFMRVFTDRILAQADQAWLMPFLGVFAAFGAFMFIALALNQFYLFKVAGRLAISSNAGFIWHVLRLPMRFFSQRLAGDIALRQASNDAIAATFVMRVAPVLINAALLVIYLTVMMRYNVLLACIACAATLLNVALAYVISKRRVDISRVQVRNQSMLQGMTLTGISMMETIKSVGAENGFFAKWAGLYALYTESATKTAALNFSLGSLPGLVQSLLNLLILMLGVALIMAGQFTAGMLLAFQSFVQAFLNPVNSLITTGQGIQEMRVSMERIEDVMHYEADVDAANADFEDDTRLEKLRGEIRMEGVTFGYSPLAEPLIQDFDMRLAPGSKVAFVGASGCGKSTLAKLISGLYDPWSGSITYDGKARSEIPRVAFTSSIAVVDQDIIMFEDSVSENIKMWDKSIEDFEVILAARDAAIHEEIVRRPRGYNDTVSEGGKNFSGGQRQRIEIACALAQDPTLLILDEATSALDAKTEYEVIRSIRERGITCVIVAHRLSTIRDADEIIVLDQGRVQERGTHAELFAAGGLYTKLISME
ncbi:MAG: NHLP family bacteriocin export ABC transporter peptidase/permease/ATPase subunit [Coriobacteriales bacterium]|jgi:NHLM bacteriocin system ABC transporter peptidase/ATP-binding protein|nr:NHLP family bacteriocin export ABC transporter peptidase/permease/ATPase subunit [Coriobacteriales bacterium]